ncbi:hypothetical protein EJ04DRAFT_301725 [Polyplosphaeria fusca]|uniref:Uncharacterized protein n=1 Tax=Polyplosphaeria fusca TaxID=682080 RepID=A0A9P4QX09_9PLEO|nr:hypothetical protein EJ04DRAFT_301725 [Polyplosphaeria fusca]
MCDVTCTSKSQPSSATARTAAAPSQGPLSSVNEEIAGSVQETRATPARSSPPPRRGSLTVCTANTQTFAKTLELRIWERPCAGPSAPYFPYPKLSNPVIHPFDNQTRNGLFQRPTSHRRSAFCCTAADVRFPSLVVHPSSTNSPPWCESYRVASSFVGVSLPSPS